MVSDALSSFNECLALAKDDLIITHTVSPPFGVIISGTFTNATANIALDSVLLESDKITCTSTNFSEDGTAEIIDDGQGYPLNNDNFSIACTRTPVPTGDGGVYYPETSISLSTTASDYVVRLRDETHLGFAMASDAQAAHDNVMNLLNQAIADREALTNQVNTLSSRIDSLNASVSGTEIRRYYQGDNPANVGRDTWTNCGPTVNDSLISSACRGGYAMRDNRVVMSTPGGPCGHTVWAVACVPN